MLKRFKAFLGAPYYIVMLPVMFTGFFGLLYVFTMLFPLPEKVLQVYIPVGFFGIIFWAVRGMIRASKQPKPLSDYFLSQGFEEDHKMGVERYSKPTHSGVSDVLLRKAPAYTVLEIKLKITSPFQGCLGRPPLVFDGFLHKVPTRDYTHPDYAHIVLKLDSPKALETVNSEPWAPLLQYLDTNPSAAYQQKGHEGFFRVASVNRLEHVVALYQILNHL